MFTRYKEALINGDKFYNTGKPCKRGHVSKRYTIGGGCVECIEQRRSRNKTNHSKYMTSYYKDNKGLIIKRNVIYRAENQELIKKLKSEYYKNNKKLINLKSKKWAIDNRDYKNLLSREWKRANPDKERITGKKWRDKNKDHSRLKAANRRAAKLQRTPKWLSDSEKQELKLIYKIAARVSKETGIDYHVDHIIPLQGETVCGLHVPGNLQLLQAVVNLSKGNTFNIN